jgi:hypothetical protein
MSSLFFCCLWIGVIVYIVIIVDIVAIDVAGGIQSE